MTSVMKTNINIWYYFAGLVSGLFLLTACGSDQKPETTEAGLNYEQVKITATYDNCKSGADNCTFYTADFPEFYGFEGANVLNDFVLHDFFEVENREELRSEANAFISTYEQNMNPGEEEKPAWYKFYQVNAELLYDSVVQLSMNVEEFSGGAHGNTAEYYRNFNLNGELLEFDVFLPGLNEEEVAEKLMQAYKEKYPEGLNMLFEESIEPTANFLPVENGVVFVYNPYDIAPYSAGVIKLRLNRM